jgi:hypothetical protein
MRMLGLLVAAALLVPVGLARVQNFKKARKTLNQVLLVDGAGSGLDADMIRGLTPEQLRGAPGPQGPAGPPGPASANASTLNRLTAQQIVAQARAGGLSSFVESVYVIATPGTVVLGFCGTIFARCNPGDFPLNCGGAVSPDGSGFLTEVSETPSAERASGASGCTTGDGKSRLNPHWAIHGSLHRRRP